MQTQHSGSEMDPEAVRNNCPYGVPGQRLWVREKHRVAAWRNDGRFAFDYAASPEQTASPWCYCEGNVTTDLLERACIAELEGKGIKAVDDRWRWEPGHSPLRWRPSIHMPRWASRILLEITAVRVERLQILDGDQAEAEGVNAAICQQFLQTSPTRHLCKEAVIHGFAGLWDSINGAGAWEKNPYVWVVEFKRVTA